MLGTVLGTLHVWTQLTSLWDGTISLYYNRGSWGTERLGDSPKFMGLVSNRAGISTQEVWLVHLGVEPLNFSPDNF